MAVSSTSWFLRRSHPIRAWRRASRLCDAGPPTRRGHRLPNRPCRHAQLALMLAVAAASCWEPSGGSPDRTPTGPGGPGSILVVVVHTVDGRHLKFPLGGFQPESIHHCREDGERHLTRIHELSFVIPGGRRQPLCLEYSDPTLQLHLIFPDRPALKVTLICESCVVPGGYYPPLGVDVRIPWSEISAIEMMREED